MVSSTVVVVDVVTSGTVVLDVVMIVVVAVVEVGSSVVDAMEVVGAAVVLVASGAPLHWYWA